VRDDIFVEISGETAAKPLRGPPDAQHLKRKNGLREMNDGQYSLHNHRLTAIGDFVSDSGRRPRKAPSTITGAVIRQWNIGRMKPHSPGHGRENARERESAEPDEATTPWVIIIDDGANLVGTLHGPPGQWFGSVKVLDGRHDAAGQDGLAAARSA